jgi:hypothetical protein
VPATYRGGGVIQTFLKTLVVLLAYLVAADIVGVVACLVLDVAPLRYGSAMLPYAIWFGLGVFAGFLAFATAGGWASPGGEGDWMERPGGLATGNRVLASSLVIALALAACFHWLYWSRGVAGDYFVPDSAPHTILFLVSAIGAMLAARATLKPGAGLQEG